MNIYGVWGFYMTIEFDNKMVEGLLKELEIILGRLEAARKGWERQVAERTSKANEAALWNGEEVVLTGRTSDHGKTEILIDGTKYHWVHKMELSGI